MKMKIYIKALWHAHTKQYSYSPHDYESTGESAFINVCSQEIEFDEPPIEVLNTRTVAAYRKELEKIRAEAHVKVENIQKQIDDMLCIENKADA